MATYKIISLYIYVRGLYWYALMYVRNIFLISYEG
jgi:hypothetical protein